MDDLSWEFLGGGGHVVSGILVFIFEKIANGILILALGFRIHVYKEVHIFVDQIGVNILGQEDQAIITCRIIMAKCDPDYGNHYQKGWGGAENPHILR